VLSPTLGDVKEELEGFVFLDTDVGTAQEIQNRHLRAIARSDFLYIVNPTGYTGTSVTLEIGYALAHSVPVFSLERPSEGLLCGFTTTQASVVELKNQIVNLQPTEVPRSADLYALQSYIRTMVRARGFQDESLRDVVLLLFEEVGELAKAVRKEVGLKVDLSKQNYKGISDELADCLIYLMDIANLVNVNLDDALREKEKINATKVWGKYKGSPKPEPR